MTTPSSSSSASTSAPAAAPSTAPATSGTTPPVGQAQFNTTPDSVHHVTSERIGKPWRASDKALTYIAVWESGVINGTYNGNPVVDGFTLRVYDDGYGNPTVGAGHKLTQSDNLHMHENISLDRARNLLRKDLKHTEKTINDTVMVPLHQYEYDALVDFLFNTSGHGKPVLDEVNKGDYSKIAQKIEKYNKARDTHHKLVASKGLTRRRKSEAKVFNEGVYDASH